MLAEQAYSYHVVALMAATISCLLAGAILMAFVGEKLYKQYFFWLALFVLFSPLIFSVARFLILVAPSKTIYERVCKFQAFWGVVSAVMLFVFIFALVFRVASGKLVLVMTVIALFNLALTVLTITQAPYGREDFYPSLTFLMLLISFWRCSKRLFPELSLLSLESFINSLDDLVLVFDKSEKLIKANSKALEFLNLKEDMNFSDLEDELNKNTIKHEDSIFEFSYENTQKYFQQSKTKVLKRDSLLATVVMLSDVTEMSVLKDKLSLGNELLRIQGKKLEDYIETGKELAAEEQKEMIVQKIEEVIGQELHDLIKQMESQDASQQVSHFINVCRAIMSSVRQALSSLMEGKEGDDLND